MTGFISNRIAAIAAIIVALSVASSRAVADDQAGYESLSDVTIRRVFFSLEQRLSLDRRRQGRPDPTPRKARATTRQRDDSAGFIVNSAGETQIYSNGDFVAAPTTKGIEFPGDVAVARKTMSAPISTQVDDSDAEPADADD